MGAMGAELAAEVPAALRLHRSDGVAAALAQTGNQELPA